MSDLARNCDPSKHTCGKHNDHTGLCLAHNDHTGLCLALPDSELRSEALGELYCGARDQEQSRPPALSGPIPVFEENSSLALKHVVANSIGAGRGVETTHTGHSR